MGLLRDWCCRCVINLATDDPEGGAGLKALEWLDGLVQ